MDWTIRNLDAHVYRAACARAASEGRPVGAMITDAIRAYLAQPQSAARGHSFLDFTATDFGPGTERLSEQIDEVLYGGRD